MLTLDALQRSSIYHLTSPVREHVIGLQLQEPNNELREAIDEEEPIKEEPVDDSPMFDKDKEFKADISNKVDLLLKFTARITTEVKKISKLIEDMNEDETMEDAPPVIEVKDSKVLGGPAPNLDGFGFSIPAPNPYF